MNWTEVFRLVRVGIAAYQAGDWVGALAAAGELIALFARPQIRMAAGPAEETDGKACCAELESALSRKQATTDQQGILANALLAAILVYLKNLFGF